MEFKRYNSLESERKYKTLRNNCLSGNCDIIGELDSPYKELRTHLLAEVENLYPLLEQNKKHEFDYELALRLYKYIEIDHQWFTSASRYRSNYEFWNYIALRVMPDITLKRWAKEDFDDNGKIITEEDYEKKERAMKQRFYAKGVRVYPYDLYWLIHLSWQGDIESTRNILKKTNTDWTLQIVERPGKQGICLDLMREIFKQCTETKCNIKKIMKNYTSMFVVFRPETYTGGVEEYVKKLIEISN